jgi:hypothetical protein
MIKTHVTWLDGETLPSAEITAKVNEMTAQGKTDGSWTKISEADGQYTIERTWTDVDAANEWINFITTFNPVLAVIVE